MIPALPALIGLAGVIMGGLIIFLTNYFTKTKETQLRILEKIFDKRIKTHEDTLQVSQKLRTTLSLNKTDRDGNALTYPAILHAPEILNDFKGLFYENTNSNVHWINIELFRELNYIQYYIETLTIHLQNIAVNKISRNRINH